MKRVCKELLQKVDAPKDQKSEKEDKKLDAKEGRECMCRQKKKKKKKKQNERQDTYRH